MRRKKKEKLNTRDLCIVDGSRGISILLSLSFFLYSHHALFIIIFNNDDIVKEQVTAKEENKSELKRRLNKQTHAYTLHIHGWWERILNTIVRTREWLRMCISSLKKNEKAKAKGRNKVPLRVQSTFITLVCTWWSKKKETFGSLQLNSFLLFSRAILRIVNYHE